MSGSFISADEVNTRVCSLIAEVNSQGRPCFITEEGRAKAVLLDINRYHALMDVMEEVELAEDKPKPESLVKEIIRNSEDD